MSLVVHLVAGYFTLNAQQSGIERIERPVSPSTVQDLEVLCRELFQLNLTLSPALTERGVLFIFNPSYRPQFQLACVAHDIFGMNVFDEAHRQTVYPRPLLLPRAVDEHEAFLRTHSRIRDESEIKTEAIRRDRLTIERSRFEHDVAARVRAYLERRTNSQAALGG